MDKIRNPFSPGAGSPPPELVGRDNILEKAKILFGRVREGRSEKSMILIGLRGVGKTVLLNEIDKLADTERFRTLFLEVHEGKSFPLLLAPHLRTLLLQLDTKAQIKEKIRYGLGVLKSFVNSIKVKYEDFEIGLDIEPERGMADSGDLEIDLPNLFVAVGEAAKACGQCVVLLIDEIQYLSEKELSSLIMAMHKMQQKQLPLILIGAGLPILTRLAGESKSYAERLFDFPEIGTLEPLDAARALQEPVKQEGASFENTAIEEIIRLTQGYPYFIQEWGYQSWNASDDPVISLEDVKTATNVVIPRLDANFFRVRFDRLTPTEKKFLKAMADLGPGAHKSGDIADALNLKISSIGPTRANLIKKGMIYSPNYGEMAFSVPLFDEFMKRTMAAES
jgi:hypothetical protein